ncbi:MAG: ABC transporter permease subunit [Dehalococcoidia bacterium]|nr:ABC transporter permease subunit [Dehalococcoidia bacterium]
MRCARGWGLAATLAALFVAWQAAAWAAGSEVLPGPAKVTVAFFHGLAVGGLARDLGVSAYRVMVSMVLSVAAAAPLGLMLGLSRPLYSLTAPLVYLTFPIPKIVLLPVLLMFLGIGDSSKIVLIFLILFFQVLVVVRDAAASVRPELALSVRSLGANTWQMLRYVFLPASLPALLTALRISVGTAIAVLFFVESFGTTSGLGYYILVKGWGRLAYVDMYAGVLAMALLGLALYFSLELLERRTCAWLQAGR